MSIQYATLNTATMGPLLEVADGNMIVTYNTTGADRNRNIKSDIPIVSGKHYWEAIVYGPDTSTPVTAYIGITTNSTSNTVTPGYGTPSVGFNLGNGQIMIDNVLAATVTAAPQRSVIGFAFDRNAFLLYIYINGALVYTASVDVGSLNIWYPTFTIYGAQAYGLSMFVNFGERDFEMPVPAGFRPGLFKAKEPISTIYLSSEDYISPVTAENPNTVYFGNLTNTRQFTIERGVKFWPLSEKEDGTKIATLEFQKEQRYNDIIANPPRDAMVLFKLADKDNPAEEPLLIGIGLVDDVELKDLNTGLLKFRNIQSMLDLPLSKRYYLPYAAEGTASRVMQATFGACRNVEPDLVDQVRRAYYMHDGPLTQVGAAYDKGDRLDPLAAPPDYVVTANQQGIELQVEPEGKLTTDISSSGQSEIIGSPDIDIVSGYGEMTTEDVPRHMPVGWYKSGIQDQTAVDYFNQRMRLQTSGLIPANIDCSWDVRFKDLRVSAPDWCPVVKGCYYRLTYKIISSNWPTNGGFGQFNAGWYIQGVAQQRAICNGTMTILAPGEYTVDFRAACDGTLSYFGKGNMDPANYGGSTGPWFIQIDSVSCTLKSAEVDDVTNGLGNFDSGLADWTSINHTGAVSNYASMITAEYPSPGVPTLNFGINAGGGNKAERYFNSAYMVAGQNYRISFSLATSSANSKIEVFAYEPVGASYFLLGTFIGPTIDCHCTATVGAPCRLLLRATSTNALASVSKVTQLRLWDITDQLIENSTNTPLQGITLTEYFREIIEKRGKFSASYWNSTDTEEIDAATEYVFGVHTNAEITKQAMLEAPMNSFGACISEDEQGTLRVVRMIDPALVDPGDVLVQIDKNNSILERVWGDLATGLTTRLGARRNWSLYQDSDFVTDTDPITGIDMASRTRFKRVSQFIVYSARAIHSNYNHARNAAPLDSLLDLSTDAEIELDRILAMYDKPRKYIRLTLYYDGAPLGIIPGKTVINYTIDDADDDGLGFETGRQMLVLKAKHFPLSNTYQLTCWG